MFWCRRSRPVRGVCSEVGKLNLPSVCWSLAVVRPRVPRSRLPWNNCSIKFIQLRKSVFRKNRHSQRFMSWAELSGNGAVSSVCAAWIVQLLGAAWKGWDHQGHRKGVWNVNVAASVPWRWNCFTFWASWVTPGCCAQLRWGSDSLDFYFVPWILSWDTKSALLDEERFVFLAVFTVDKSLCSAFVSWHSWSPARDKQGCTFPVLSPLVLPSPPCSMSMLQCRQLCRLSGFQQGSASAANCLEFWASSPRQAETAQECWLLKYGEEREKREAQCDFWKF